MQDGLGTVQRIVALGASSDIARSTLDRLVGPRTEVVVLAARDPEGLKPLADELLARGADRVERLAFDALSPERHETLVQDAFERAAGDVDVVLVTFGVLGDQSVAEHDAAAAVAITRVNFVGAVSVLVPVSNRLRAQGHGTIVALSSVAGERARRSNFVYGSSKAGLDAFLQGLGDELVGTGVRVMIVRPGFVHSRMTEGMDPAPLAVTPDDVADAIVAGLKANREIVWVPAPLRYVMSVLRHLPRPVFRRLPL